MLLNIQLIAPPIIENIAMITPKNSDSTAPPMYRHSAKNAQPIKKFTIIDSPYLV